MLRIETLRVPAGLNNASGLSIRCRSKWPVKAKIFGLIKAGQGESESLKPEAAEGGPGSRERSRRLPFTDGNRRSGSQARHNPFSPDANERRCCGTKKTKMRRSLAC